MTLKTLVQTQHTQLYANQPQSFTQGTSQKLFSYNSPYLYSTITVTIQKQPQDTNILILFSLYSQTLTNPPNSTQTILQSDSQIYQYDYDAYASKQFTHTVQSPSIGSYYIAAVSNTLPEGEQYSYSILLTFQSTLNCLPCQNGGSCILNTIPTCQCPFPQSIGKQCQFSPSILGVDNGIDFSVQGYTWLYFSILIASTNNDYLITFQNNQQSAIVSLTFIGYSKGTYPNLIDQAQTIQPNTGNQLAQLQISSIFLQTVASTTLSPQVELAIGYYNLGQYRDSLSMLFTQTAATGGSQKGLTQMMQTVLLSFVALCVFLVTMAIVYYLHKRCYQSDQTNNSNNSNNLSNRLSTLLMRGRSVRMQSQVHPSPQQTLSMEELDKYMPKVIYGELQQLSSQEENLDRTTQLIFEQQYGQQRQQAEECTVCLIEFAPDNECRVTICEHIFHSVCLEQWLARQTVCALCRRNLALNELQNFQKQLAIDIKYIVQNAINAVNSDSNHLAGTTTIETPLQSSNNFICANQVANQSKKKQENIYPILFQQINDKILGKDIANTRNRTPVELRKRMRYIHASVKIINEIQQNQQQPDSSLANGKNKMIKSRDKRVRQLRTFRHKTTRVSLTIEDTQLQNVLQITQFNNIEATNTSQNTDFSRLGRRVLSRNSRNPPTDTRDIEENVQDQQYAPIQENRHNYGIIDTVQDESARIAIDTNRTMQEQNLLSIELFENTAQVQRLVDFTQNGEEEEEVEQFNNFTLNDQVLQSENRNAINMSVIAQDIQSQQISLENVI